MEVALGGRENLEAGFTIKYKGRIGHSNLCFFSPKNLVSFHMNILGPPYMTKVTKEGDRYY